MLVKTERKSKRKAGETRGMRPLVHLTLQTQHSINGRRYGPGAVTVPRAVADVLCSQESNALASDHVLHQSRSAIIGAGGRMIVTPNEFFDGAMGAAIAGTDPRSLLMRT
jgi:hypothetical protein